MTNSYKKKKSFLRRLLKWSGITLVILLAAIICIPYFFKDELKQMVLDEVNHSLNAKLELDQFDLTFFSTFPNLSIQLEGVRLKGVNEFEGITLADVANFRADVGLWDVVQGEKISIDAIYLEKPNIDVRVLYDGTANYDIVKPDTTQTEEDPSNFELALNYYSISEGIIRYDDKAGGLYAKIENLNHEGAGDLTADIIDFNTTTSMDALTFEMGGLSYLSDVKTDIVANLVMNFSDNASKFTLKENSFQLNALKFGLDGYYEILEDKNQMDLTLDAKQATFKELISLVPVFYRTEYESMIASGSMALNAKVKGILDDVNLPGWDVSLNVQNASIKYPDLPKKIDQIAIKAKSIFAGGNNLDQMQIVVDKFHANLAGNSVDAKLNLSNTMSDPAIKAKLLANLSLGNMKDFVPLEKGENLSGKLDADINLDGKMSSIEQEKYEDFNAAGQFSLIDFVYESASLVEPIQISEMKFLFSPKNLNLENLQAKTGNSNFNMSGTIDNYLGYAFRDELLKGDFTFKSSYLDLDEIMNLAPADTTQQEIASQTDAAEDGSFEIPGNIDFRLNTAIKHVKFNGMDAKNVSGIVTMKEKIANLSNLNLNALGGYIGLSGSYNTQNPQKPKASFAYTLKQIDVQQLASNFLTIEKLAPVAKYLTGDISSSFKLTTDLNSNMEPVLSSVNGLGDLLSSALQISNFKVLDKVETVTKLSNLNNQTLKNIKAKFEVKDGQVSFKPFEVKLGGIKTNVSGTTGLDQSIDYALKMLIPKEKIPKQMIQVVEQAAAKVNSLAPKLNLDIIPKEIPINVNVLGTILNPKISSDFKEQLMKASGNMKDALVDAAKDKAKEVVNEVKDSVKTVINNTVEKGKEELEKQKQAILSSAQAQADKVKAEGKKAADQIRQEADKAYQKAVDAAGSNPFKKKAAEIAAKKVKDEAYKKATQVENEATKKADGIMAKARDEANNLK